MRVISPEETAQLLKEDPRYSAEAYLFISEALDFTTKALNKPSSGPGHHITAAELLDGIRKYALQEYGPMVMTILNTWGIHECRDFGQVVFNLVNKKILGKSEEDSLNDFNNGFDFNTAFRAPFEPDKKLKIKN
ncbi:MAG: hypothetical protein KKE37_13580 [Verrucomicrobia bacterium]|nr:hypothetical protein [Verrucomicrobiota bacterium]MBU4290666.1 hypothetical protein [Verrucomicrobiota bacterium]MBU4430370.1 hypothetical protein [Verrucomicrobiota bacterium]MCG2681145.1 hypothetical protein [Kiritimatiellia bacterium]